MSNIVNSACQKKREAATCAKPPSHEQRHICVPEGHETCWPREHTKDKKTKQPGKEKFQWFGQRKTAQQSLRKGLILWRWPS